MSVGFGLDVDYSTLHLTGFSTSDHMAKLTMKRCSIVVLCDTSHIHCNQSCMSTPLTKGYLGDKKVECPNSIFDLIYIGQPRLSKSFTFPNDILRVKQ